MFRYVRPASAARARAVCRMDSSARCPAGISHPQVAMLARRINGKYLAPKSQHLADRVREIENGDFQSLLEALMDKPLEQMQELYNHRDIEQ